MEILFALGVGLIVGAVAVWLLSKAKIVGLDERVAGRETSKKINLKFLPSSKNVTP